MSSEHYNILSDGFSSAENIEFGSRPESPLNDLTINMYNGPVKSISQYNIDKFPVFDTTEMSDTESETINYSEIYENSSINIFKYGSLDHVTYAWKNVVVRSGVKQLEKNGEEHTSLRNNIISLLCDRNKLPPKTLLNNAFGIARPGELVAIMGASGSGKTTLMNAMTFRNPGSLEVKGEFFVNGVNVEPKSIAAISAYIQQEDAFIGSLTVREHLNFHSRVRMDRHVKKKERTALINDIMEILGLTKCADVLIGDPGKMKGISGGERKKLAFASEVLTDPKLMFCDEPTSGLDSFSAANLVTVLEKLAMDGRTIICTIHQPSSAVFTMFNRILLLAEGRVAFLGSPQVAMQFFELNGYKCPNNYNPSDFYIDTLAIQPLIEENEQQPFTIICNAFDRSHMAYKIKKAIDKKQSTWITSEDELQAKFEARAKSPYKASWFIQFRAVLWRTLFAYFRDFLPIVFLLVQSLVLGFLIGMVFYDQKITAKGIQNIHGCFFLCLNFKTYQYALGVMDNFSSEQTVFYREHHNGMYRVDVYFLCKTLVGVPAFIVLPVVFTCICYYMVGFTTSYEKFFQTILIFILVANTGASFGFLVSSLAPSINVALVVGPGLIMPLMIFGGFFINSSTTPFFLNWIHYISWFYYAFRALEIVQFKDLKADECNDCKEDIDGENILRNLDIKPDGFIFNVGMLAGLCVAYRLFAFCALFLKAHYKK